MPRSTTRFAEATLAAHRRDASRPEVWRGGPSRRSFLLGSSSLLLTPATAIAASAEKRFALIVANQAYSSDLGPLQNTHRDADIMADALRAADFDLPRERMLLDVDKETFEAALREYVIQLTEAGPSVTGVFYYSGHGAVGSDERNYAIPINSSIKWASDLPTHGVALPWIVNSLSVTRAKMNFVFFDACRNVLLQRPASKGLVYEAIRDRPGAENIFLGYAAALGQLAGDTNLFAEVLAAEIKKVPGDLHVVLWHAVRKTLAERTNKAQVPWSEDWCPERSFYFRPPAATSAGKATEHARLPARTSSGDPWTVLLEAQEGRLYFSRQARIYQSANRMSALRGVLPAGTELETEIELGDAGPAGQWYKFKDTFGQTAYAPFHDGLILRR